jgi:hypothetical protein
MEDQMKTKKVFLYSFVMLALLLSVFLTKSAVASVGDDHKVSICHATSSASNPYNSISVDKNSTAGGHSTDTNDIIPPFTYYEWEVVGSHEECPTSNTEYGPWAFGKTCLKKIGGNWEWAYPIDVDDYGWVAYTYPGLNYDALGAAILGNDCVVPPAEEECPTTCGYAGGTVPDGLGGLKTCPATDPCDPEGTCPSTCGYDGGTVPDGQGGLKTCPPTHPCDPEGTCPTACGYEGGEVSDGQGGVKTCPATNPCEEEGTCPTACGYEGGEVPDGQGGLKTCPATDPCDPEGTCPTKCGYQGGEVPDGSGGWKICPATKACKVISCGIPDAPPCEVCPGEPLPWNEMINPPPNTLNFIWTVRDKCSYTWNEVTHMWESPHMNPVNWRSYGISTVPFTLIWDMQYLPAKLMSDGLWFISAPPDGTWILIEGTYEGPFSWTDWPNLTRIRDAGVVVFHYESCRGAVLDEYK